MVVVNLRKKVNTLSQTCDTDIIAIGKDHFYFVFHFHLTHFFNIYISAFTVAQYGFFALSASGNCFRRPNFILLFISVFEMSKAEFEDWRSQFASSKEDKRGLRYAPFCFTEQGVTMLSCVLNSQRAIAVNIQVIRVFTKMREMLLTNKDILLKLEQIERKIDGHDEDIQLIFKY